MQYGGLSRREAASLEMVDGSEVKDPIPTYSPGTRSKINYVFNYYLLYNLTSFIGQ